MLYFLRSTHLFVCFKHSLSLFLLEKHTNILLYIWNMLNYFLIQNATKIFNFLFYINYSMILFRISHFFGSFLLGSIRFRLASLNFIAFIDDDGVNGDVFTALAFVAFCAFL